MPSQTIKALRVDVPGPSLAIWLAQHHPDLFLTVLKQAQTAQTAQAIQLKGLRGLGDDPSGADVLQTVTLTTNMTPETLPPNLLSDSSSGGWSFLSSLGSGLSSVGSVIGGTLSSAGSGVLSALGSVGSYLGSKAGLSTLTSLGQSYFAAQGASANAQAQQAVLQAQVQRAAAGQTAAPITYQRDAYGNVVPAYVTQTAQGSLYQPLSSQGIANLTPSSLSVFLSRYGLWLGLGALAIVGFVAMRNR